MNLNHPDPSGATRPSTPPFRLAPVAFTLLVLALVIVPFSGRNVADGLEEKTRDFPLLFLRLEQLLRSYYLDLDRAEPKELLGRALTALENAADEIYVDNSDPDNPRVKIHVGNRMKVLNLGRIGSIRSAFSQLTDIFNFISEHYVGDADVNEIRYATANGFLTGLDPHTIVFSPKAFQEFYEHIEGEIYGVGMLVGVRKGRLHVIQVLKGTPAARAGFKNGDIITKIGDESTINMDVQEAVQKIRGPKGEEIVLTIKRRESKDSKKLKTIPISVARDRVEIKSVESKLLPGGVGYIDVRNFDKNTVTNLRRHLARLKSRNENREISGLILDLRRNSGGLLKQAAEMSDMFLSSGDLYHIADNERVVPHEATNDGIEPSYPILLLASESSASGAEIVIGALQKNDRGLVLGSQTFGKGSVQQLHTLRRPSEPADWNAQLKITVSEYLIPGKISIQENGVVPDILAQRAVFSDEEINLDPDQRRGTESDYEAHIVSKYAKKQEPVETLRYPYEVEEQTEEFGDKFMAGELEPMEDRLVRIAVDLLELAGDGPFSREEFLRKNKDGIDAIRKKQFADIVSMLAERGIDWSDGKNTPGAEVDIEISHSFKEEPTADEDDPYPERILTVKARLTNRSDAPLYRVAATSFSDYYLLNEREFLFGKVAPGESIERTADFTMFPSAATRSDVMRFEVRGEGLDEPLAEHVHEVVIEGEDTPDFAYSLRLEDTISGKAIDRLQPGTRAKLIAEIRNTGNQTLRKGIAILRNKNGREIFLEVGRIEIEEVAPGATTSVTFEFHVRADSSRDAYEFEFLVGDAHYPTSVSQELKIPARDAPGEGFENGRWYEPPSIDLSVALGTGRDGLDEKSTLVTDQEQIRVESQIRDDSQPFNAWVGVTPIGLEHRTRPDKVTFSRSRATDGVHRTELDTGVRLEVGQNLVSVIARDEDGLVRRKVFYVRRKAAPSVTRAADAKSAQGS